MNTAPIQYEGISGGDVIIQIGEPTKDGLIAFLEFLSRGRIRDCHWTRFRTQDTPNRLILGRRDVADIHRLLAEFAWMRQPPQRAGLDPEAFEARQ